MTRENRITTLGSTGRGGSIFILNVAEEVNILITRSLQGNVSSECTIWTADCNISGSHAAIGTFSFLRCYIFVTQDFSLLQLQLYLESKVTVEGNAEITNAFSVNALGSVISGIIWKILNDFDILQVPT